MLVCVFSHNFARETAGAARTRHSLRPLISGADGSFNSSDASRREVAELHAIFESVIGREAGRSRYGNNINGMERGSFCMAAH
jgi:hypothetical protein